LASADESTRCQNREEQRYHPHRRENLKSIENMSLGSEGDGKFKLNFALEEIGCVDVRWMELAQDCCY
jgi:hypothetical protein